MNQLRASLIAIGLSVLSPMSCLAEETLLSNAFAAGEDKNWDAAYRLVGLDLLAHDLITWTRLRGEDEPFADYVAFQAEHTDWPGMDRVRARGEAAIDDDTDPNLILSWMEGHDPETGMGGYRLALAQRAVGQTEVARETIRRIWLRYGLTEQENDLILAAFGPDLADLHVQRADAMLWRWKTDDAERLFSLLPADQRALMEARVALIRKSPDWGAKLQAVPVALLNDVGLAYDRFNFLSDRGDRTDAITILLERSTDVSLLSQPYRWSSWRRSHARWEMREGRYDSAYRLAAQHHLTPADGESYADLEWLAGYVALRFLNRPEVALRHFLALQAAVESPISDGRAGYWLGRTYEALGDSVNADAAYSEAAEHQTAFYGLLAGEKLGQSLDLSILGYEDFPDFSGSLLSQDQFVRAAFYLLDADERGSAVLFFAQLGRTLDRTSLGTLGEELLRRNEPFFALLIGKSATTRGIILPALLFPMHDLREMDLPVEPELALSIARRESEFNPVVGSAVGALGLMQLMPGTAEDVANELGLPYSRGRLTADWQYNATLGSQYLAGLEEQFGPTPVMIAAGYNAGPRRPREWMEERGDPRLGEVDVIDWIEMIPFRETRNYVQRVTESLPIYRARLSGQTGPIRFTELLVGEKPLLRPVARPWTGDEPSVAVEPASGLAPMMAPRPMTRP